MTTRLKGFEQIDPMDLQLSPFTAINKEWMELVVGAERGAEVGAMTCSWGGLGVMWNKPVAFVAVRGEEYRFTRRILDEQPVFSLCFLPEELQDAKAYLGRVHGWDVPDKIAAAGLHTGWCGTELEHVAACGLGEHRHTAFIEESRAVLLCEKICCQELPRECFVSPGAWERWYAQEGQHKLYIAEIRAAFVR